jgi:hypothetical protein
MSLSARPAQSLLKQQPQQRGKSTILTLKNTAQQNSLLYDYTPNRSM